MTITGTNFDATPANNTVFIGGIKATVTAASVTSLTVTVPSGAGFGPISVTVNNRTAISDQFFLPTFTATVSAIDASTFATKVDFAAAAGSQDVEIGDIDGDGNQTLQLQIRAPTRRPYFATQAHLELSMGAHSLQRLISPRVHFPLASHLET